MAEFNAQKGEINLADEIVIGRLPNIEFDFGEGLKWMFYTERKYNWLHKKMWKFFFNAEIKELTGGERRVLG